MKNCKKDRACIIGFKDLWLRLIGIPIISLLLPFVFFGSNPSKDILKYLFFVLVSVFYTSIYWHLDRAIVIYFRKKLPEHFNYSKRVILQSIVIIAITVSLCSFIDLAMGLIPKGVIPQDENVTYLQSLSASLVITIIIVLIYETTYAFDLFKEGLIQNEALKKENAQAQLHALKTQINPHFLFNSLNTLTSIIPEDSKLAVEFVESLSKVYRYILEIKDKDLVSLNEELKCIEAYEYLLKIRFGNNIRFIKSGINGNKNSYLIPLSIQMLIENAVKHNVVSKSKPLIVTITANTDSLSVKNNLQLKSSVESSTKTGLINIQKRFEILTKKHVKISENATSFEVVIPLIKIGKVE